MRSIFLIFLCGFLSLVHAQDTTHKTTIKVSMNYSSHLHYYGRTDSLQSSGLFPMAEVWFANGIYFNASPVFVSNKVVSLDYAGTIATIGYLYNDPGKWITHIYALKPFYEKDASLVQSALKMQGGLSLTKMGFLNISAGADVKWSDDMDFGLSGGLDHVIQHEFNNSSISIVPAIFVNAGTQQFTNTYYKKSDFILFPGFEQQITEKVKKFQVLSYEASVPVIYSAGKLQFIITPSFVAPQNILVNAEKGNEKFYVTSCLKIIM